MLLYLKKGSNMNLYNFTTMTMINKGTKYPMRVDTEGGMIECWHQSEGHWIWSDEATKAFKHHLFSRNTTKVIYYVSSNKVHQVKKEKDELDNLLENLKEHIPRFPQEDKDRLTYDIIQSIKN